MNLIFETTYVKATCGHCGIGFAVDTPVHNRWVETGKEWFCPNGHKNFYGETTNARLERDLAARNRTIQILEQQQTSLRRECDTVRHSRSAVVGHVNRLRKRIAAGTCPCCHRSFENLQRHMSGQHPDYAKAEVK